MTVDTKRWTKLDQAMLKRGWVRVQIAADKMGVHRTTIDRALEEGSIRGTEAAKVKYVSIKDCLEYLGDEAARALGLKPESFSANGEG